MKIRVSCKTTSFIYDLPRRPEGTRISGKHQEFLHGEGITHSFARTLSLSDRKGETDIYRHTGTRSMIEKTRTKELCHNALLSHGGTTPL